MNFTYPIVEGTFQKREKRFFSFCKLDNGNEVVAHCPNSGSMKGNLGVGSKVWLMDFGPDHLEQKRKLRYKWVAIQSDDSRVIIDTNCANQIVGEAISAGKIKELAAYTQVIAEKKISDSSRIDFFLPGKPDAYVEVKSVSMGSGLEGYFPDSVTERGQKHIKELIALRQSGNRAILFFLLMRSGASKVGIAKEIDPKYDELLKEAIAKGVEVLVYGVKMTNLGITLEAKGEFLV